MIATSSLSCLPDVSSWSVDYRSGSIRVCDTHPAVKFFFSLMQFGATGGCLYGLRRFSILSYTVFIVQGYPFLIYSSLVQYHGPGAVSIGPWHYVHALPLERISP
jgi:hypothetical protein